MFASIAASSEPESSLILIGIIVPGRDLPGASLPKRLSRSFGRETLATTNRYKLWGVTLPLRSLRAPPRTRILPFSPSPWFGPDDTSQMDGLMILSGQIRDLISDLGGSVLMFVWNRSAGVFAPNLR